jgi:hypothetical protein
MDKVNHLPALKGTTKMENSLFFGDRNGRGTTKWLLKKDPYVRDRTEDFWRHEFSAIEPPVL